MRVLLDALGCGHGGIATYLEQLVTHWVTAFPDDDLHLLRGTDDPLLEVPGVTRHEVRVPRPDVLTRPAVQTRAVRRLVREQRPDAVLSVRPVTPLTRLAVPLGVVVHDLRHEIRPEQFTAARRLVRRVSYGRAYAIADGFVCISARTRDDLHRLHPGTRARPSDVVHHGADHVDGWPRGGADASVLAFGHHTNKNVDTVLAAWAELVADGTVTATTAPLTVVGLGSDARAEVAARVREAGIEQHVVLAPYLPDPEFQALMAAAAMVLFPSEFEGFGLPVVEAMRLGIPVVVGPEPAVREIAGGHAIETRDFSAGALADGIRVAFARTDADLAAARHHAERFTWARTAAGTRAALIGLGAGTS